MLVRESMHRAGATALSHLLNEEPPESPAIPCSCGHSAIAARYIMFSTFSMEEKRQTLRETVERITIDRNGLATFQVRGGYPVHTPEFAGTPQALEEMESLRVLAQSYKDDLEHAKFRSLS